MELLSDAGEFVHRGSTQSVPVPVLMFLSHYAYEDAGPPETGKIRMNFHTDMCLDSIE